MSDEPAKIYKWQCLNSNWQQLRDKWNHTPKSYPWKWSKLYPWQHGNFKAETLSPNFPSVIINWESEYLCYKLKAPINCLDRTPKKLACPVVECNWRWVINHEQKLIRSLSFSIFFRNSLTRNKGQVIFDTFGLLSHLRENSTINTLSVDRRMFLVV